MKNQIFNLIKVTALAAILAAGVSAVSAFTAPTTAPAPTPVPVNVSSDAQKKVGGFISELFLKSGIANAFTLTAPDAKGWIIAEDTLVSPWSFSIKTFLPGTESQMKIGSPDGTGLAQFTDATFPLTIDLAGRGTAPSPKGRDAIELLANTNYCNTQTTIRTNTPGIQFWSTKNGSTGDNADLVARQVQLNGGNPAKDKVLISTDAAGNATWAKVKVTNGVISYTDYTTSPAAVGQAICGAALEVYHWEITWKGCRYVDDSTNPIRNAEDANATCRNSNNQRVNESYCASLPAPVLTRTASNSLPMCTPAPVDPPATPTKLWYCHLQGGNWVDMTAQYAFAGSCGSENYQAGYYKSNTYVCSKTQPTGSTCLSPAQLSSGNYTPIVQGCSTAAECLVN